MYINLTSIVLSLDYFLFRYPPFDPFNTTYIPLPGPSSPHFALPLTEGNPHNNSKYYVVRGGINNQN